MTEAVRSVSRRKVPDSAAESPGPGAGRILTAPGACRTGVVKGYLVAGDL